jgi:adenylylsulfate kinase
MYRETSARSIAKAISWRILGTVATTVIVFIFTHRLAISLAVGGLEFLSKIGLFFVHERIWDRVHLGRRELKPAVIWFTGLSGSGKSTLSGWVCDRLRQRGYKVEHLDGDSVRNIFPATGFTRSERDEHIKRVGFLASKLEQHGVVVVASFVSPYQESRDFVRRLCRNFVEIHVATPLEECERRDTKGLYAKARRGEIKNFTGINDPYEQPRNPELTLDTRSLTVDQAGRHVMAWLREHS